jgi:Mg2+ and Co2+ transporter CorA
MNVRLPLSELFHAFYILAAICVVSALLIWLYFSRKKWI